MEKEINGNYVVKYRVWDNQESIMIMDWRTKWLELFRSGSKISHDGNERYIVERTFNRKDKHGNDIYKGDIIMYDKPYEVIVVEAKVKANNRLWGRNGIEYIEIEHNNSGEIIGNIYKNKELLK